MNKNPNEGKDGGKAALVTDEQWIRVKDVFEAALELDPAARDGFLTSACGDDAEARAEVERLLRDYARAEGFLEQPLAINALAVAEADESNQAIGRRIGQYEIISEIGRGGMSVVYLAERADDIYHKQVAIKLVWSGPAAGPTSVSMTDEIERRFRQERRILAQLDHPNIARLLDGGMTEDGWQYVIMEYIEGVPITEYCGQQKLSLNARLKLFQEICEAVQYAHQNLIVHRDLKPNNILITSNASGEASVKLLDFGIAKILGQGLEAGGAAQPPTILNFLTPEYASPEQLRGEPVTTASDVYGLGVLLYELLTGRRPFEIKSRSPQEILRLIEEQEALRPSHTINSAGAIAETEWLAPDEAARWRRQLSGDLDNVALKALDRDPKRRYQSARQLSEDIARYLNGEPVIAREATLIYGAGKFIKRRKTQIVAVALATAALLGAVAREVQLRRNAEGQNRIQRRQIYSAQMQRALQYWQEGNLPQMRETLDDWLPQPDVEDLRGFEWRYLWRLLNSESFSIETPDRLTAMALAPDGRMIGAGMKYGSALLYDLQTGEWIATLSGHQEVIRGIAFSPDGKLLGAADAAGVARLWEIPSNREKLQVSGHGKSIVHAVAFSPDGKTFATGGRDGVAKLWSAETGEELVAFRSDGGGIRAIVFSPDRQTIFTGSDDRSIRCWDVTTGRQREALKGFPVDVVSLAMTPDGKYLAASGADSEIKMWEIATGKIVRTFAGHTDFIWKLAISPDGRTLASGSVDRTARLWDIASGREIDKIKGHDEDVSFLAFTPDGRQLITGDSRRLKLWELNQLPQTRIFRTPTGCKIEAISLSPDGKWLVMGESVSGGSCKPPAVISLWDVESAKIKLMIPHQQSLTGVGFIGPHNHLGYSDVAGLAGVIEIETAREITRFTGHQNLSGYSKDQGSIGAIRSFAIAPDGRLIATGSESNSVKLWTADGREARTLHGPGEATEAGGHSVHAIAFSRDGRKLAIGGYDPGIPIFDLVSGQKLLRLAGHRATITTMGFSPDDRLIATAGEDTLAKIWKVSDGQLLQTLKGHAAQINCLAWTPDGKRLVTASKDRTIRIWNAETGNEVLALNEHTDSVTSLVFSRDGRTLFSASWDGTVRQWRAATDEEARARK